MALNNPGFESGNTVGWTITANGARPVATTSVVTTSGYVDTGTYAVEIKGGPSGEQGAIFVNTGKPLIKPNSQVSVSAKVRSLGGVKGNAFSWVGVRFYNADGTYTDHLSRMLATNEMRGGYVNLAITATAPAGAMYASMLLQSNVNGDNRRVYFDTCSMTVEEETSVVTLTYPVNGTTYEADMEIPLRVKVADGFTLTSLEYKVTNTLTAVTTSHTPTNLDWSMLISGLDAGAYTVQATGVIDGNNLLSNVNSFTVGAAPPKTTREFKASNSFTQLILSKIESVAQEVPSIAVVNGCEIEVAYSLEILARTLDKDVVKEAADPDMVFNLLNEGVLEVSLLQAQNNGSYSTLGGAEVVGLPINRADFEVEETGTSGDFAWNHFVHAASPTTVVIGGDEGLFGLTDMAITDFLDTSMGFRFYPSLRGIPEGSDSGEVCVRIRLDQVKVSVFFDAGSVEYYFATPDGVGGYSEVIKGTLISANVLEGSLRNGDGAGAMQLAPLLQDMDSGSTQWPEIKTGSTIHSAYYPTPKNQIGVVDEDMRYNGLPIKQALDDSRTKSQFITANFYGDERMDSMYGVNGVDRAFSYNGEYFYKIYTQADADKDRPRHVAYHHAHLALGYKEGRVDVSVAGEPWNFSGLDGASSWGIGDSVTGMIPLSGTVLGIFCDNSVIGLSGTTVDNFATQVISPRMGALEYTVVDMGYPVYANSYGIYTLNQTQQYGDFLGNPLSQDISTWIRPRLNTDPTALASVNMAYPVRSKNQYRLSFTDNHILTMTMNYGQQSAPTFSLHNYGMTPTAVSSQLDQHGREKLHFTASPSAPPIPPAECAVIPTFAWLLDEDESEALRLDPMKIENAPSWLADASLTDIYFDFYDNGTEVHFYLSGDGTYVPTSSVPYDATGKGTIRGEWETETSVCVQWSTPQQTVGGLLWRSQYIVNGDMNGVAIPDPSIPTEVYFSSGNGGVLRLIPPFYYEELAQGQTIKLISCQYGQAYSVGQDGWIGGCDTSNWDIWWAETTNDENPLIGMPYAATSVPYDASTNAAVIAEDGSIWMTVSGTWTKIHDAFWEEDKGFGYIQSHRSGSTVMVTVYSEDRTEAHSYVFTNSSAGVWRSAPVGTSVAHDRVASIEDGELVLRLLVNPSSWTWVVAASVSVDPGTEIVNVSVGTAKDRTDPETFIYLQLNSVSAYVYRQGVLMPCRAQGYIPYANSGPGVAVRQNHPDLGLIYQQVCREGPFVFMSYAP